MSEVRVPVHGLRGRFLAALLLLPSQSIAQRLEGTSFGPDAVEPVPLAFANWAVFLLWVSSLLVLLLLAVALAVHRARRRRYPRWVIATALLLFGWVMASVVIKVRSSPEEMPALFRGGE